MRFGWKASPHFGQVLAVVADLAKVYFRAWSFLVFLAEGLESGWGSATQKSGPLLLVTALAERDHVGGVEAASTFGKPVNVVSFDVLSTSAAPAAVAVPSLDRLPYLLPSSTVAHLHGCAGCSTLSASLALVLAPTLGTLATRPMLPRVELVTAARA